LHDGGAGFQLCEVNERHGDILPMLCRCSLYHGEGTAR
jgi:hypothetical protein